MIRLGTAASVLLLTLALAVPARAQLLPCVFDSECDDSKECTTDSCNLALGTCSHAPLPNGESCGGACTGGATCQEGECVGGTPVDGCIPCQDNDDCEDGSACTIDTCNERGRCEREGADGGTCDDEDPCTLDDRCTDDVCAGTPLVCDDGAGCTADVCDAGTCVNTAESSSCPAATECATAECSPDDPAADAQGCVPRSDEFELSECSEDDNPCTDDRCRGGACAHDAVADPQGCQPLLPSYRRGVLLRAGTDRVLTYVLDEVAAGGDTGGRLVEQLEAMSADLDAATRVLAGRDAGSEPPAAAFRGLRLSPTATTAQQRGFIALAFLRGTPARVQRFLGVVSQGRRRRELESDAAGELRRNGRILLAGTKALKGDLKNLQKTFSVFQR